MIFMDGTITDTTTPDLSVPGIDSNESVLHILHTYKYGASLSDFFRVITKTLTGRVLAICKDVFDLLYNLSRLGWVERKKERKKPWVWSTKQKKKKERNKFLVRLHVDFINNSYSFTQTIFFSYHVFFLHKISLYLSF